MGGTNADSHAITTSGAFIQKGTDGDCSTNGGQYWRNHFKIEFNAQNCSAVYGRGKAPDTDDDVIIPKSLSCRFCIKY